MEQSTKTIITLFVLIAIVFGLYAFTDWFSRTTGYVMGEDEKINLAQCLTEKGATFYKSSACPSCEEQIALFGDTASKFLIVNVCNLESCPSGGVPAWRIEDKVYYGIMTFDELMSISGCAVFE